MIAEFKAVGKSYTDADRDVEALAGFDLQVRPQEVLVLMGPSGCGKSTALSLLAGHEFPSMGTVLFADALVSGPGPERTLVFQSDTLFPWLTVEQNVSYGPAAVRLRRLHGLKRLWAEFHLLSRSLRTSGNQAGQQSTDYWLSRVRLDDFSTALPKQLSGGMRKRVELARAYALLPTLLLLDEPFASLDALTREEMQLVLETLWQETRCTTLLVTHDASEAVALADRIAIMTPRPGRVHTIVPVPFPHPRDENIRRSDAYLRLAEQVRETVRDLAHGK